MAFLTGRTSLTTVQTGNIADDSVTEAKIANDAIGLAELKAGTDGELITWDASGNPTTVPVGTSTHVLTSNGAGAAPTFQAASGAYDLHTQGSYSSATQSEVAFTSLTHDFYILHLWNVQLSASEPLMIAISYDNGSNYSNAGGAATALTNHWYSTNHCTRNNGDIATEGRHGTTAGETEITGYSDTYKPANTANLFGTMTIERKKDGELYPGGMHDWSYHNAGYAPVRCNGAWFHTASGGTQGDMDAFKIYPNSGTFSDIHFKLYGTNVT